MRSWMAGLAVAMFALGFHAGVNAAVPADGLEVAGSGCEDDVDEVRRVVPRRVRPAAPRCESCGKGVKICCPDCSLWVNKSCVCDCGKGKCSCE